MLIIEVAALENGAHRNQEAEIRTVPPGWIKVPRDMESRARGYLPFIVLDIDGGALVGVSQGDIPEPVPVPESEPTAEELINILLGVDADE